MVSKMAQGMGQDGNQDGLATKEMGHPDLSVGGSWRFREVFSEGFWLKIFCFKQESHVEDPGWAKMVSKSAPRLFKVLG